MLLLVSALLFAVGQAPTNSLPVGQERSPDDPPPRGAPTIPLDLIKSPKFVPLLVQVPKAANGTFVPVVVPKPTLDELNDPTIRPIVIKKNQTDSVIDVASNNDNKPVGNFTLEQMIVKSVEKAVEEIVAADLMVVASAIQNDTEAESVIADTLKSSKDVNETVLSDEVEATGQNNPESIILSVETKNNGSEIIPINSKMAEQIMKALDVKKMAENEILKKIIEIETVKNIESDIMSTISNKSDTEIISIGESLAKVDTNVTETTGNNTSKTFPMSMVIAMVIKAATEQLVKQMPELSNSTGTSEEALALAGIARASTNNSANKINEREMPGAIFVIINDEPSLNTTISAATINLLTNSSDVSASNVSAPGFSVLQNSTKNLIKTETIEVGSNSKNKAETVIALGDVMNTTASSPVSTSKDNLDSIVPKEKIIIKSSTQVKAKSSAVEGIDKIVIKKENDNPTKVLKVVAEPISSINVATSTQAAIIDNSTLSLAKDEMKVQPIKKKTTNDMEVKRIGKQLNTNQVTEKQAPVKKQVLVKKQVPVKQTVEKQVPVKQTLDPATESLIVNKHGGIVFGSSHFGSSVSPANFILGQPVQIPTVIFNSGPPAAIPANMNPQLLVEPRFRKFIFPDDTPDVAAAKVNFFQVRAASPGGAANALK